MSASGLLSFSSTFDGGNGTLLSARLAEGCIEAVVAIRPDVHSQLEDKTFMQWFSFRCSPNSDNKCQRVRYMISNAASASYPKAWTGTTVCFSHDAVAWQRCLDTSFDTGSGVLSWTFDHCGDGRPVHFSYFATYDRSDAFACLFSLLLFSYPYERVLALVARCGAVAGTRVRTLGHSLQGREISCVSPGRKPNACVANHSRVSNHSPRHLNPACRFRPSVCNRLLAASRAEPALLSLGSSTGHPQANPAARSASHRSHTSSVPGSTPAKRRAHFSARVYCGACSVSAATAASVLSTA
jgi:hypothetical protein